MAVYLKSLSAVYCSVYRCFIGYPLALHGHWTVECHRETNSGYSMSTTYGPDRPADPHKNVVVIRWPGLKHLHSAKCLQSRSKASLIYSGSREMALDACLR
jgi:hypothetical protein